MAAIVVTYNRYDTLKQCLSTLEAQTRAPDYIIVVDNASPDGTASRLLADDLPITVIESPQNLGVGGGLALGLSSAIPGEIDDFWLIEDDTQYVPDYLRRALNLMESSPSTAMIGGRGWTWRGGLWRGLHEPGITQGALPTLDGALVRREAVRRCGYPKSDYFMMIQDVEYPLRMVRMGLKTSVWSELESSPLGLGASAADGAAVYRAYYQVRNHLDLVKEYRSPGMLLGFVHRLAALLVMDMQGPRSLDHIAMRCAGLADGLSGRTGRVVAPGQRRPSRLWRG